ncbi:hypothetical protein L208DRAFT_1555059 [Tricholoma matsutake]|nr:hypothetical protein L208DRAFT_1555059 [Tricholoma matsutake 945]
MSPHGSVLNTFQDFIQGMTSTSFNTFSSRAGQHKGAFEEMRSHILKMYAGVTAHAKVTSFISADHHVDCIAIMEQPSVFHLGIKNIKKPPLPLTPPAGHQMNHTMVSYVDSLLKKGLKDQFGTTMSCPTDMIPMLRLTMDRLTQFSMLKDFFMKHPGVTWDPVHKYAAGHQVVVNYGGNSWMELWLPISDYSVGHQRYLSGTQTVKGGWAVYPQHFQTMDGVLYIYWNSGKTGCFNLDCPGFMQIDKNWGLGGRFPDHYSTPQKRWGFWLQWKLL